MNRFETMSLIDALQDMYTNDYNSLVTIKYDKTGELAFTMPPYQTEWVDEVAFLLKTQRSKLLYKTVKRHDMTLEHGFKHWTLWIV